MTTVGAILLAGGRGSRLGARLPKALVPLGGMTLVERALARLGACPAVDRVVVVIPEEERARFAALGLEARHPKLHGAVVGGALRQHSAAAGLAALDALPEPPELVVVHDAARCLVDPHDVARTVEVARAEGAALLARPVRDTLKRVSEGVVIGTPPRSEYYEAQTPQVFRRVLLREAHAKARAEGFVGTDDATLVERLGVRVHVVEGGDENLKITHPADLAWAQARLGAPPAAGAPARGGAAKQSRS